MQKKKKTQTDNAKYIHIIKIILQISQVILNLSLPY